MIGPLLLAEKADDDERTSAQGLFNYADAYLTSAGVLMAAKVDTLFPEEPVRFLLYHAAELYLKAFLRSQGMSLAAVEAKGHQFTRLIGSARQLELRVVGSAEAVLVWGQRSRDVIETRYIRTGLRRRYPTETLGVSVASVRKAVRTHPRRKPYISIWGEKGGELHLGPEQVWKLGSDPLP